MKKRQKTAGRIPGQDNAAVQKAVPKRNKATVQKAATEQDTVTVQKAAIKQSKSAKKEAASKQKPAEKPKPVEEPKPRIQYKDTVFRMLFNNKENLLSLYNAVNGTVYTDVDSLEITTLENAGIYEL